VLVHRRGLTRMTTATIATGALLALACLAYVKLMPAVATAQAKSFSDTAGGSRFLSTDGDGTEPMKPTKPQMAQDAGLSLQTSSLADTQADGSWSIGPNGQAQPSMALRRRFDYLLLLQGERSLAALTAEIQRQVLAAHGAIAAQQVLALWNSYLQLQQKQWLTQVDMRQPSSFASALSERSLVRRELLGIAWADAFYREEEDALRQQIAKSNGQTMAASSQEADLPAVLPDAALRQAEVDAEWQQWRQRLEAARAHVAQLQQAPELSATQRTEAVVAYINSQFSGTELLRAKALLKL
jgi:lipase chaperone LimK